MGGSAHRKSLYSPCLTKHVEIHPAFPYNRYQIRGQTSFEAYPIFYGRKAQIFLRLVRLRSRYTDWRERTCCPSQWIAGVNTLLYPFLWISLSSASLAMCRPAQGCSASVPPLDSLIYTGSSVLVSGNSLLKAKHSPLFVIYRRHLAYPSLSLRHRIIITEDQEKHPITLSMSCMKT